MLTRIRDGVRYHKPQQKISFDDWEQITTRASLAAAFFKEDNYTFITMKADFEEAEKIILENRIFEVHEEITVSTQESEKGIIPQLKRIFITPKKIQVDELVGRYKYIKKLFAEFQTWIDFKKELESKEAKGEIEIEHNRK